MHNFIAEVKRFIFANNMIEDGETVVVAVSGGPDSLALLYMLSSLREELNFTLHVAHLDHKFRGVESAKDALFVKEHARKLGLAITLEEIDVPRLAKEGKLSDETAARRARYEFYDRVAADVGAAKIALGHNADDQAETVLMRLLRGSGSHGLSGIPRLRDGKYIRPLLSTTRSEIESFLADLNLSPRQDASNEKPIYRRNKIRLELLPLLESEYNPSIKRVLNRTAEILRSENDFLDKLARENLNDCLINRQDELIDIDIAKLREHDIALQRRILRHSIADVIGDGRDIGFEHIESILPLISSNQPNSSLSLPHNLDITKSYGRLAICKTFCADESATFEYELNFPEGCAYRRTTLPELNATIEIEFNPDAEINHANRLQEMFDGDKIVHPRLQIRKRRDGDRFQPLGMRGTKKLKDFFIDEKVPLKLRDRIPILVNGDEILWVVGYRISDKFKITSSTAKRLKVTFIEDN